VALNIKDKETEALVSEIASLTGETETEVVRQAARERLDRLERERAKVRADRVLDYDPLMDAESMQRYLETEIWPLMSGNWRGKRIPKALREEWLGYGPDGV
jgi:antitoxin VapB